METDMPSPQFTPRSSAQFLAKLPFDEGETVARMAAATLGGQEMLLLASSAGRIFLLEVAGDQIKIAGPLEFTPA